MSVYRKHAPVFIVVFLSVLSWLITYKLGLVTTYNDAMSHLDIARLVVDNQQPGIAQLGSVWLPLNHILMLPLIWNQWAWHSGFAGSIISMLAYVASTVGVYKIITQLTDYNWAAYVGTSAFALNLNLLYLQSTPLTEVLFVSLMTGSMLYLIKYLKTDDTRFLLVAAVLTALQIITRYDGWFMAVIEVVILVFYELHVRKRNRQAILGNLVLFVTPIAFGMLLWFGWNALIFGNPLYSFIGPYSAHAQQNAIANHGGLITKGNLLISTKAFGLDVIDNVGLLVTAAGVIGWLVYLSSKHVATVWFRLLVGLLLAGDIIFNIVALVAGFSILNVPQLHWNPSHTTAGMLFNVRYGITALPFLAVGFGLLATRVKRYAVVLLALVVLQGMLLLHGGLITVRDGTVGSSSFTDQDIANELKNHVKPNQKVLMSSSHYNAVMFQSHLNLSQYVHEGVSQQWNAAVANPTGYAQWIVMANGNTGETVYNSLVIKEKNAFLSSYKLAYAGKHANVYEIKTADEMYARAQAESVQISGQNFKIRGVNSYDLAYQNSPTIDKTFQTLQAAKVDTVRFWLFGDGNDDGFQPTVGAVNEARFKQADYVFVSAAKYHIRVIPTLVNNWQDYGGADQYLQWAGLDPTDHDAFYTNPAVIQLYENYIDHVLARKNTISGTLYSNDPSILAWDIMNEPRSDSSNPQVIAGWIKLISDHIHDKDKNHLITAGFDTESGNTIAAASCANQNITLCSVHVYLEQNGQPLYQDYQQQALVMKQAKDATAQANKPLLLSEIGIPKTYKPYRSDPLAILAKSTQQADRDGYTGWLIWNWSLKPDSSYGFSPDGTNGHYTQNDLRNIVRSDTTIK